MCYDCDFATNSSVPVPDPARKTYWRMLGSAKVLFSAKEYYFRVLLSLMCYPMPRKCHRLAQELSWMLHTVHQNMAKPIEAQVRENVMNCVSKCSCKAGVTQQRRGPVRGEALDEQLQLQRDVQVQLSCCFKCQNNCLGHWMAFHFARTGHLVLLFASNRGGSRWPVEPSKGVLLLKPMLSVLKRLKYFVSRQYR